MDAFFAAVEERDDQRLSGLPIVVGADPEGGRGRGVVSTANYKARAYGIHSAMPISRAWQLAGAARGAGKPAVVFLPVNGRRYAQVSGRIMALIRAELAACAATVAATTRDSTRAASGKSSIAALPAIEEASIDEAYLDLSFAGTLARARDVALYIKNVIKNAERLTCSIGIGPNKLIAKIASDMQKPDGLTVVGGDDENARAEFAERFLEPLPLRKIPGIGPKTELLLRQRGLTTVRDLRQLSQAALYDLLGQWGLLLYDKIRGRDDAPLIEEGEPKSIGEQETFGEDTLGPLFLFESLSVLCGNVMRRFERHGFASFRTVVITVRFADFETKTRARTLLKPARDMKTLQFEAMRMLAPFLDSRENGPKKLVRLIGVRVEGFA
ncbi:MAG: DNA polymerase IV [bacterium]|nr:DNA polymerase IV [bacterium]